MFPSIDFRNARYQGQIHNQLPHGVGILLDRDFLFCLAEWSQGEIQGHAMIVFPEGKIFCGRIIGRQPEEICLHELEQDHVQLLTFSKHIKGQEAPKLAAIFPLLKKILDIDNSNEHQARVINQYPYSTVSEPENIATICQILHMQKKSAEHLFTYNNCIKFVLEHFVKKYDQILEFLITSNKGKKEYFIGLKGEGLGIRLEPIEELKLNLQKEGRVYMVRGVGIFSKENQLKDLALKTIDNVMKGLIRQEGIYSRPSTIKRYEAKNRPAECVKNFMNYLKGSLSYRDQFIDLTYIQQIKYFSNSFDTNLKRIQTEKVAQFTIQEPNNNPNVLAEIERRRREKERQTQKFNKMKEGTVETSNFHNPSILKITSPEFDLLKAKEEIYKSLSKKKATPKQMKDYHNISYESKGNARPQSKSSPPKPEKSHSFNPPIHQFNFQPQQSPSYQKQPEAYIPILQRQSSKDHHFGKITTPEKPYVSPYKYYKPSENIPKKSSTEIKNQPSPLKYHYELNQEEEQENFNHKKNINSILKNQRRNSPEPSKYRKRVTYRDVEDSYSKKQKDQVIEDVDDYEKPNYPDSASHQNATHLNSYPTANAKTQKNSSFYDNLAKEEERYERSKVLKNNNKSKYEYHFNDDPSEVVQKSLPTEPNSELKYSNRYRATISPDRLAKKLIFTPNVFE